MAPASCHQHRQERPGHIHQPLDVGVHHDFPVVHCYRIGTLKAQSEPGVVHEHFDVRKFVRQGGRQGKYRIPVAYIQCHGMDWHLRGQRFGEFGNAFGASCRQDDFPAVRRKLARRGCTKARRSACDKY